MTGREFPPKGESPFRPGCALLVIASAFGSMLGVIVTGWPR